MILMQHKNVIYRGVSSAANRREIDADIAKLSSLVGVDLVVFDSSELQVSQWEEVLEHFLYFPQGMYKIILFEHADELSEIMQNKLLKQIEESSNRIITVFNTTKPLLATVESRGIKIKVKSSTMLSLPDSDEALLSLFKAGDLKSSDPTLKQIRGLYEAIIGRKSLIRNSGLLKEKSAGLSTLSSHLNEIAQLILLKDIHDACYSHRSKVAQKYLECEPSDNNLYNLILRIESLES